MLERWLKPRTEHPEPQIRIDAFRQVDPDDPAYKEAVRFDPDAGVRASLLERLTDLPLLLSRCHDEEDAGACDAARSRLTALLCAAEDGATAGFISRLDDAAVVTSVGRDARSPATRAAALARAIETAAGGSEFLIAVACADADTKLRGHALDALTEVVDLETVATTVRKSDKDLHRHAREKIRAIRDGEEKLLLKKTLSAEIVALAQPDLDAHSEALHRRIAEVALWRNRWATLGDEEGGTVPAPVAAALREVDEQIEAARAVVDARAAVFEELAGEVDSATVIDPAAMQARWLALGEHSAAETTRFERALAEREARVAKARRQADAVRQACVLIENWEKKVGAGETLDAAAFDKQWQRIGLARGAEAELDKRHESLQHRLLSAQAQRGEAAKAADAEASALVRELAEHLKNGRSAEASASHDRLRARLARADGFSAAPAARVRKRLDELAPELNKLREWRLWATDQAREAMCKQAEALLSGDKTPAPKKLADQVKTLRKEWQKLDRGIGPAPDAVWKRFDSACEKAYAPAKEHFDKQAAERREHAAQKRAICERLEVFARETDWEAPDWRAVTTLLDESRKAWRSSGGVSPKQFNKLRERFGRAVAALEDRLTPERDAEVRRRELAIEALKKSAESEPLGDLIESAKRIQRDWRPTVQTRRKREQELWQSLRVVCDEIFSRRDERVASQRVEEGASRDKRDALCAELDTLLVEDTVDEVAINQASGRVAAIRDEWRAAGPLSPKQKTALENRFRKATRAFDGRRRTLQKRAGRQQLVARIERTLLLDEKRQRLSVDAAADCADLDAAWAALPAQRGAQARAQEEAFAAGAPAAVPASHLKARRALCLRAELIADVPSPDDCSAERMALKVSRLQSALGGGPNDESLDGLLAEWSATAPVEEAEWAALRARFEVAIRKLADGD